MTLAITTLLPRQLWAQKVEAADSQYLQVYISNTSSLINMQAVTDAGKGDTEANAINGYIPLGGTDPSRRKYSTIEVDTRIPDTPTLSNGYILAQLTLTNSSTSTATLYAAARSASSSSTNYTLFNMTTTLTLAADSTSSPVDSLIDLDSLCTSGTGVDCTKIDTTTGSNEDSIYVYYFMSTSSPGGIGSTISSSTYANGLFVRYYFSDKVPVGNMTINKIYNGDGRLLVDYSGGEGISNIGSNLYKTYAMNCAGVTCQSSGTLFREVTDLGGQLIDFYSPAYSGLLDLKDLVNNADYNICMGLTNKFQYASPCSASVLGQPQPIEALLEKQACFLLTAGFGGEHPVVEYFRWVRDTFLLKFGAGKMFVQWYYDTAPAYAPTIHESPWLSAVIRLVAYILYLCLHALPLMVLALWYYLMQKRRWR